jgi:CPA1 family monovalent cation:H+ antiporter
MPVPGQAQALPPYSTWIADVTVVTDDAAAYLRTRLPDPAVKSAIVLGIDNTSLETAYKPGFTSPATAPVLEVAKQAPVPTGPAVTGAAPRRACDHATGRHPGRTPDQYVGAGMNGYQLLLVLIGAIAVTAFAQRRGLQPPLAVVALASLASFLPGMPQLHLDPDLILGLMLPPLLYSTALDFSFVSFTRNIWAILALGVGLVIVTAVVVGLVAVWVIPGLSLAAAMVLGAAVAPPDAVTAVAVGRRLGLPKRLTTILTGESLVNDAAALTIFALATAAVAGTHTFLRNPVGYFVYCAVVGTGVGLLLAIAVHWLRVRLCDAGLETVLGTVVPFAAYLIAEQVHASGVLAVVAAGFWLGHHAANAGFETRLQSRQVWRSMDVLLEAFIFAYMGLQLRFVIEDVIADGTPLGAFLGTAALVLLVVIVVRPLWVFLVFGPSGRFERLRKWLASWSASARRVRAWLHALLRESPRPLPPREKLPWAYNIVMSWAGMRGVVTLAAAAGVPATAANREPFPGLHVIQAVAFFVAVGTLLIQGSTLPALIRGLDLSAPTERDRERDERRRAQDVARHAARQATAAMIAGSPGGADRTALVTIEQRVERYLAAYQALHEPMAPDSGPEAEPGHPSMARDLIQNILAEQRRALVQERDAGCLDDEVLRTQLEQLDYEEAAASRDVPNRL